MNLFPSSIAALGTTTAGSGPSWLPSLRDALRPAGQTVVRPAGGILGANLSASVANALASMPIPPQGPPPAPAVQLAPAADLTAGGQPAPGVMPPDASALIDGRGRPMFAAATTAPPVGLLARLGLRPVHVVVGLVLVGGAWYFLVRKKRGG